MTRLSPSWRPIPPPPQYPAIPRAAQNLRLFKCYSWGQPQHRLFTQEDDLSGVSTTLRLPPALTRLRLPSPLPPSS